MARSVKGPVLERLFGGRSARATLGPDLKWTVVVAGGSDDFDAGIAATLADSLATWTELFVRKTGLSPALGEPVNAAATFVARWAGWTIVDPFLRAGGSDEEVKY